VTGRASRDSVGTLQKDMAAQQTALAELARRVDSLGNSGVGDAVQALIADQRRIAVSVNDLGQRIEKLESQGVGQASAARTDQALVLAVGQLREALAGSGPYDAPVAVIRALAPDDAGLGKPLQVLDRNARTGVRSTAVLASEFKGLIPSILHPTPAAGGSWTDRALGRLESLVSIRRVDERGAAAPAGSPDRAVTGAEAALNAGDLPGAIEALQALVGSAAEAAQGWLAAARDRVEAERAASDLVTALTQRLGKSAESRP
jgi:uroporphyrinogen-III synthase